MLIKVYLPVDSETKVVSWQSYHTYALRHIAIRNTIYHHKLRNALVNNLRTASLSQLMLDRAEQIASLSPQAHVAESGLAKLLHVAQHSSLTPSL